MKNIAIFLAAFLIAGLSGQAAAEVRPVGGSATCTFNGQPIASGAKVTAYKSATVAYGSKCTSQSRTCSNGKLSGTYTFAACTVAQPASCTFNDQTIEHGDSVTAYKTSSVAFGKQCVSQQRTCTNGKLSGSYTNAACTVGAAAACTFNGQSVASGASVTAYQASSVAFGRQCVSQQRTCTNGTLSGSYTNAACTVGAGASCTFNGQTVTSGASVTAYQAASVAFGQQCVSQQRTCTNGTLSGAYTFASCSVQGAASCTFNGQTVASGASVTAYQAASVAYGQECVSQQRSCTNGTLSGSYTFASCSVQTGASCTFNGQTVASGDSVAAYSTSIVPFGQQCVGQQRTCTNGTLSGSFANSSCSVSTVNIPPVAITSLYAVYSPAFVKQDGTYYMYIGGWKEGPPHDHIYRLTCTSPTSCTDPVTAVDPTLYPELWHTNDPTVVRLTDSGTGRDYYVMYMTGVYDLGSGNDQGMTSTDNHIFYSVSWANDGLNWTEPAEIVNPMWLPAATVKDGRVYLYGNSNENGTLYRYDMGTTGVNVGARTLVHIVDANGDPSSIFYINVDVQYQPSRGIYSIFGQYIYDWDTPRMRIDYLTSTDGVTWRLEVPDVVGTVGNAGYNYVNTPAFWPDTPCSVFFGVSPNPPQLPSNIYEKTWC